MLAQLADDLQIELIVALVLWHIRLGPTRECVCDAADALLISQELPMYEHASLLPWTILMSECTLRQVKYCLPI